MYNQNAQETHAGSQAAREDGLFDVSQAQKKMYVSRAWTFR
jgi:hypothetical protein